MTVFPLHADNSGEVLTYPVLNQGQYLRIDPGSQPDPPAPRVKPDEDVA